MSETEKSAAKKSEANNKNEDEKAELVGFYRNCYMRYVNDVNIGF